MSRRTSIQQFKASAAAGQLEARMAEVLDRARELAVETPAQAQAAALLLDVVADLIAQLEAFARPGIKAIHDAHKTALAQLGLAKDPLVQADKLLRERLAAYHAQIEAARSALIADAPENCLVAAQDSPVLASVSLPKGIGTRKDYHVVIDDWPALLAALAARPRLQHLAVPNNRELDALAAAGRLPTNLPGCHVETKTTICRRGKTT